MDKLKRFLEGSVVIPYSDNILEAIDTACHSYNKDEDINRFELFENMVECFLTGKDDKNFHAFLNDSVEKEGTLTVLPNVVVQRIAGYKSYTMVMEADCEEDSAIMATIFMNYILLVKKRLNNIPCSDLILEIYNKHLSCYIKDNDKLRNLNDAGLIKTIAEAADPIAILNEKENETNINKQLLVLAKSAAFYQYDKMFNGNDVRNIEDPFARIFVALCKMVHETSYCYYDYPFYLKSMELLSNDECKCRKSIGKIIDSVQSYADEWPEYLNSNSSLLLRLIKNENKDSISTMLTTQLGVKEFTVYLYYELMVEEILNLMYDDGE